MKVKRTRKEEVRKVKLPSIGEAWKTFFWTTEALKEKTKLWVLKTADFYVSVYDDPLNPVKDTQQSFIRHSVGRECLNRLLPGCHWGRRDSLLVRAPDSCSKGCEFESRKERRENCLLHIQLCVMTLILCPFDSYSVSVPPPCYPSGM